MAKVHKRTARKDYPTEGIKRGDTYYTWQLYRQPVRRQKAPPRRSQLTSSEFLGALYDLIDGDLSAASSQEDFENFAQAIRDLGDEQQGKLDNMPDQLQEAESGQMLQTRIEGCSNWADEIDNYASNLETTLNDIDGDEELSAEEKEEKKQEAIDECRSEIEGSEPDWG